MRKFTIILMDGKKVIINARRACSCDGSLSLSCGWFFPFDFEIAAFAKGEWECYFMGDKSKPEIGIH